jgi:GTP diphosphokinase / guanosine-3',5'-bis(diphosphate) 3'-diphosphatase
VSFAIEGYESLIANVKGYMDNPADVQKIVAAFDYAKASHANQKRSSGEPYITHPLAVAYTLSELKTDPTTIIAGLLHDVLEDTPATFEEVKENFGEAVALLIEGVTKLGQYKYRGSDSDEEEKLSQQAQNYQKMLIAMAKDIRVIIVKLADRLHNIRTLHFVAPDKQTRIAQETLDIYAPLAHRLGMNVMKAELEDTAFKYLNPPRYAMISQMIMDTKNTREKDILMMRTNLEYLLRENHFEYDVKGRVKNIYSVHKKMQSRNKEFEEIYDLLALRVIVSSLEHCYSAIGVIHSKWTPIPNRFKDYIAMPKPNLYQSLHTSIIANGKIYEIQIRTEEMDDIAEYGVAAHWAYKGNDGLPINETISNKLKWYSDLIQFTEEGQAGDVVDLLKEDIFHSNVYVFTPDGDIIDLPVGSMPLDFAFRIHTEVGLKSVGAIVNNKIVPLEYKLQTGDIIKMKTSKQSFGPNDNWLKLVKTSNARSKIKNYLNKQRRDELVEMGRSELLKELSRRHHEETFTDKEVRALFEHKGVLSLEDLYYEIGKNTIKVNNAANALVGEETYSEQDLVDQINKAGAVLKKTVSDFVVEGLDNPSIKLANCCSPLPGDEIVGYVSKGIGIAVHRKQCNNVKNFDEERLISVSWGRTKETIYNVNLRLTVGNRDNILADVINATTASKGKVNQVLASTNARGEAIIKLKVGIKDLTELETVIQNLNKIKDVYSIERPMR